jgi:prophage regulatory protein
MSIELIKVKQVCEEMNIPMSTLYRWISQGDFPRPIKLGPRSVAFRRTDIIKWLDEREKENEIILEEIQE